MSASCAAIVVYAADGAIALTLQFTDHLNNHSQSLGSLELIMGLFAFEEISQI
jgi:hypothetical protein